MRLVTAFLLSAALGAPLADGQSLIGSVPVGRGNVVAVNPSTHRAYIADETRGGIAVVDGVAIVATIQLARTPAALAVNAPFNLVYAVNNDDGVLSIIDGNTNTVRNLAIGAQPPLVVNELRNRVYVGARGRIEMLTMEGQGDRVMPMPVGPLAACDAAVSPQADQLYVAHCAGYASVVDLLGGAVTTFNVPGIAAAVAVNPIRNRGYVASRETPDFVTVIDGASKAAHSVRPAGELRTSTHAVGIVVSPNNNRAYLARGFEVDVLDLESETFSLITTTAERIRAIAVDDALSRVMVLDGNRRLLSIDVANRLGVSDLGVDAWSMGVDTASHRMYAAGTGAALLDLRPFFFIPDDYQGMWWNPSESGWGVALAQQGNNLFASWFTYDEFGHPAWFVMPAGRVQGSAGKDFNGTLYRVTGSPLSGTFDPARTDARVTGFMSFHFTDANSGTMEVTVNDARITKTITRQAFAPRVPVCGYSNVPTGVPNYTDIWWRASESGWGLFLAHQGDNILLAWFTYDTDGTPMWLVGSNIAKTGNRTYSGALYRTTGPPFTASPWSASRVVVTPVGTATLAFPDGAGAATFTYSVGGVSGQKSIGRAEFSSPLTRCG